jgi:ATP-dependent Clp protease ATP-binding subunit ClpC
MATAYRFPMLIWKDHQGWYTASLLEWDECAGMGRSPKAAREQLEEMLAWKYQRLAYLPAPDFRDPALVDFKVPIRPEYHQRERRYPCKELLTLRVCGVTGCQEQGLFICVLPLLGQRFFYRDPSTLRSLAIQYAQEQLNGMTPQELSRHLPPATVELDEIVIRVDRNAAKEVVSDRHDVLQSVAEPIGDPRVRRLYSRPWEREQEVTELKLRLTKKANVVLVGENGCGKTTVLVDAAGQQEKEWLKEKLRAEDDEAAGKSNRRFWLTGAGRIIAGMKYLGQWEERCENLIAELARTGGILCVDNLLDLLRQGGEGPVNSIAAFLMPYLQRGELTLVGEATPAEFDACRRLLLGFADLFGVLSLPVMTRQQAVNVLDRLATIHQQNMHLEVAAGVIDLTYHLFKRFLPYQAFPGPASRFLTQLFESCRQAKKKAVTPDDVLSQFVRQTGLPELFLRDDVPLSREQVLAEFRAHIIGQEQALDEAASLVITFKAGLNDPNRPIGVLLFCGPTGVGKTELARTVARYFFGHGVKADRLIRLDMSEYAGPGAGDRLLTQADGQPSALIRGIREQPFSVVLFDEIEKADAQVFDVLMGAFDEGRMTDRFGRTAIFRSAIMIMTSNLGVDAEGAFGFGKPETSPYETHAMDFFRPEFFNRIDAVVAFDPLDASCVQAITRKELTDLAAREGLVKARIRLTWTNAVVAHLAQTGFDRRYGARPLQRTIERQVIAPLSCYLLANPGLTDAVIQLDLAVANTINIFRHDCGERK